MKCRFLTSLKDSLSVALVLIGQALFMLGLMIALPVIYLLGVVAEAADRVVRKIKNLNS